MMTICEDHISRSYTRRETVVGCLRKNANDTRAEHVADVYAPYSRGTIGFVKFTDTQAMWKWVRSLKGTKLIFKDDSPPLWFRVECTQDERERSKAAWIAYKFLTKELENHEVLPHIEPVTNKGEVWAYDTLLCKVENGTPNFNIETLNMLCHRRSIDEWMGAFQAFSSE